MKIHPDDSSDEESTIVPFRTDAQLAQELRDEIAPHMAEICRIMDKARAAGLKLDFGFGQDAFGRHIPPHVLITKAL